MEFTNACSYAVQVAAYIRNGQYGEAYGLSQEFLGRYPEEVASHFMHAKAAFWLNKYEEAEEHGLRAYNLAHDGGEMSVCAIIAASAMYMQGKYRAGYMLLNGVKLEGNPDAIKLSMIFAIVMEDAKRAVSYYDELAGISRKAAEEFVMRLAGVPAPSGAGAPQPG